MKTNLPADQYGYYPRTAISLCVTSYLSVADIPAQVTAMNLEVVWGPARKLTIFDVPYSLMFIARNPNTGEHFVVIRGTDPISLTSWVTEDFEVHETLPFATFVPGLEADIRLSEGTFHGLEDLLSLQDPTTGKTATEFLVEHKPAFVYVTGHSLGGTLTPPLFAYLHHHVYGGDPEANMCMWSFAGLTSGNKNFADYIDRLTGDSIAWRIHNPFDVAPLMFGNKHELKDIYDKHGYQFKSMDWVVRELIELLFQRAEGNDYQQPGGENVLPSHFNDELDTWIDQASYQHHSTTYQKLVYEAF